MKNIKYILVLLPFLSFCQVDDVDFAKLQADFDEQKATIIGLENIINELNDKVYSLESNEIIDYSDYIDNLEARILKLEEKTIETLKVEYSDKSKELYDDFIRMYKGGEDNKKISKSFSENQLILILKYLGVNATTKGTKIEKVANIKEIIIKL